MNCVTKSLQIVCGTFHDQLAIFRSVLQRFEAKTSCKMQISFTLLLASYYKVVQI